MAHASRKAIDGSIESRVFNWSSNLLPDKRAFIDSRIVPCVPTRYSIASRPGRLPSVAGVRISTPSQHPHGNVPPHPQLQLIAHLASLSSTFRVQESLDRYP